MDLSVKFVNVYKSSPHAWFCFRRSLSSASVRENGHQQHDTVIGLRRRKVYVVAWVEVMKMSR